VAGLCEIALDDRYTLNAGRIHASGVQALVQLLQR
jgi:hypothetical protein